MYGRLPACPNVLRGRRFLCPQGMKIVAADPVYASLRLPQKQVVTHSRKFQWQAGSRSQIQTICTVLIHSAAWQSQANYSSRSDLHPRSARHPHQTLFRSEINMYKRTGEIGREGGREEGRIFFGKKKKGLAPPQRPTLMRKTEPEKAEVRTTLAFISQSHMAQECCKSTEPSHGNDREWLHNVRDEVSLRLGNLPGKQPRGRARTQTSKGGPPRG